MCHATVAQPQHRQGSLNKYNYISYIKLCILINLYFLSTFNFREESDATKRLKKNEAKQEVKDSLVLKLRDRSIDLASFTDSSAMYPICRAWIKNDPLSAR